MGDYNGIADSRYGKMIYNKNDLFVGRSIKEYGEWCQDELELLKEIIRPGMTVLDIGANIGTHALAFSKMVGKEGKVLAFEPQRKVYYSLAGTVAINSIENIWCNYCAVSDKRGVMEINQLNFEDANNFGALRIEEQLNPKDHEEVRVILLDDLGLESCDVVKVDAEGMEEKVLRGAVDTIEKFRPVLFVENELEHKSESLISYIRSLGYDFNWYTAPFYNPNNFNGNQHNIFGGYFSRNMLCIPKEKASDMLNQKIINILFKQDD